MDNESGRMAGNWNYKLKFALLFVLLCVLFSNSAVIFGVLGYFAQACELYQTDIIDKNGTVGIAVGPRFFYCHA